MVKSKKNPRPKGSKASKKKITVIAPGKTLDSGAMDYARLLADPCNAPLVHPVYAGGDAGFLFRAESFVTFGTLAGETAGVVHWTPGYVNASGTQLLALGSAAGGTAGTAASFGSSSPGNAFLTSNARGVRCVAACLKVTFPGSESARAGRVHYGHTQAGLLDLSDSVTPDNIAQTLQHYSRTPTDTIELIWKPGAADTEFNDPGSSAHGQLRDRKGSITVAFAGLPAAVGLTFHLTAVYEWTPAPGLGVAHNALGKNRSRNTLDDVVDSLIAGGFTFARQAGGAMLNGAAAATVGLMQRTFGLMPAQGRVRAITM